MDALVTIVARVLGEHSHDRFCSTCIGLRIEAGLESVRAALSALGREIRIERQTGDCSVCGQYTQTYGLRAAGHKRG